MYFRCFAKKKIKDYCSQQVPSLPKRTKRALNKTAAVSKTVAESNDMEFESNDMEPAHQETAVVNSESDLEDLDENEIVHAAVVHHEEDAAHNTNKNSFGRHSWKT